MAEYQRFYELEDNLQTDSALIPSPELYAFDDEQIYAAIMNRLAQPLPTGEASPFSAQTPGSAHGVLVSNLVYLQSLLAHELNLVPDSALLAWLRILGTQLRSGLYPVVYVRFTKTRDAVASSQEVFIPTGTEVRSITNPSLSAFTTEDGLMGPTDASVLVPCRLNSLGPIANLREGEFSQIPSNLTYVETAANEGAIAPGRPPERLIDAVLRTRDWLRTGDRCVTDRDYHYYAIQAGAIKANVIRGITPNVEGFSHDLRTIAVYPAAASPTVQAAIASRKMADERLVVIGAEVIPITGRVGVRAVSGLSQAQVFNLVATAIRDRINPPKGRWGDPQLDRAIADALERTQGIYAAPEIELVHADTRQPLSELAPQPWWLFETQSTLTVEIL